MYGMIGSLISGSAQLLGGMQSAYMTSRENARDRAFNMEEAQKTRDFSALEAQKTRDWQENMSNTAYQRAMSDMQAAGLNPALMYGQGGASTPSGATGSGGSAATSHHESYAQSAKMAADGLVSIGQMFVQRGEAMAAKQAAREALDNKAVLKSLEYDERRALEKFKKSLGHVSYKSNRYV